MAQQAEEPGFHDDVLETILSHVPLVDLVAASYVSKQWRAAVSSSLRHRNKPRPWLILHTQIDRYPYTTTSQAYDPRSGVWVKISRPPIPYVADLKSSHSNIHYMLSPSRFSFSFDPLGFDWCHVSAPYVWRRDPIVARVGNSVVIAGGGFDFEDDPMAVEIYDLDTRAWRTCDSMPGSLRDSSASPWLSIAAGDEKLVVTEKESGLIHWFDPATKSWSEEFKLSTGQPVQSYNIGYINNTLVLFGLCKIQNVVRVKIWRVREEDFHCEEEIGEMPLAFVEKLRSESFGYCSVNIRVAGNIVYVYNNTWGVEEVVACEFIAGGGCEWWSVSNAVAREERIGERLIYTCSDVGINELDRVMRVENRRFEVSPPS